MFQRKKANFPLAIAYFFWNELSTFFVDEKGKKDIISTGEIKAKPWSPSPVYGEGLGWGSCMFCFVEVQGRVFSFFAFTKCLWLSCMEGIFLYAFNEMLWISWVHGVFSLCVYDMPFLGEVEKRVCFGWLLVVEISRRVSDWLKCLVERRNVKRPRNQARLSLGGFSSVQRGGFSPSVAKVLFCDKARGHFCCPRSRFEGFFLEWHKIRTLAKGGFALSRLAFLLQCFWF